MGKKLSVLMIVVLIVTGSLFAQFKVGDTELTLLGTVTHLTADEDYWTYYSYTIISLTAGFGHFISPNVQLGIQPTWNFEYRKYKDTDYSSYDFSEKEKSDSDGILGVCLFTNFNIVSGSEAVPYLSIQYQISNIAPEGGATIGDVSALNIGGGLRYFLVEKAAINSTLLYSLPLKDAKYKYKSLSLLLGLSIII
ncbi:hypothetical protein JW835_05870 [bacterium]|nr:hypothetical protein [bacterium]